MEIDPIGYRKKNVANNLRWNANQKAANPEQYLQRKRDERATWVANNPEKAAAADRKSRAKAKASGRHRCNDCDKNFPNRPELLRHLGRDIHKNKVKELKEKANAAKFFAGFKRKADEAGLDDVQTS